MKRLELVETIDPFRTAAPVYQDRQDSAEPREKVLGSRIRSSRCIDLQRICRVCVNDMSFRSKNDIL